jgi:hypothetical protein
MEQIKAIGYMDISAVVNVFEKLKKSLRFYLSIHRRSQLYDTDSVLMWFPRTRKYERNMSIMEASKKNG